MASSQCQSLLPSSRPEPPPGISSPLCWLYCGAVAGRQGGPGAVPGRRPSARIQILPLICSEKCPAQRTLTPINPTRRSEGERLCCWGTGGRGGRGRWRGPAQQCCASGRQQQREAPQCRRAPAQSICSLFPARLGHRQVHFRATGQIDSSAFIFFRLRSGSC